MKGKALETGTCADQKLENANHGHDQPPEKEVHKNDLIKEAAPQSSSRLRLKVAVADANLHA